MIRLAHKLIGQTNIRPTFLLSKQSNNFVKRWTSTDPKPYRAAILEEFNGKLSIESIRNRAKLGDGMVKTDEFS